MRAARLTLVTSLLAVLALGSLGATQATKSKAPAAPPPPPPAIVRFDPRVFDIKFESIIAGFPNTDQPALQMEQLAFVLPIVFDSPTSRIDPSSMKPEMWFDNTKDTTLSQRAKIEGDKHLGQSWAIIPLSKFQGSTLRWTVSFRAQAWSVGVDDARLNQIAWPREWPKEVADALRPQLAIESDSPAVKALVASAIGENARTMPPYVAAKEIIRASVLSYRGVQTDTLERRGLGRVVGMRVVGSAQSLANQQGSTHDVLCTCVAALRAAGIPARPVIGIGEIKKGNGINNQTKTTFLSWGQFFLPDAGWVSFDPEELRGNAVRQLKPFDPWPGIGTLRDLNRRVAMTYSFMPEGLAPPAFPACWSFQGTMGVYANRLETYISLQMISRGKGKD